MRSGRHPRNIAPPLNQSAKGSPTFCRPSSSSLGVKPRQVRGTDVPGPTSIPGKDDFLHSGLIGKTAQFSATTRLCSLDVNIGNIAKGEFPLVD